MKQRFIDMFAWFTQIGSDPDDGDDLRLQKSLLVVCAFPFMIAGVAWGVMYILFNEPLAGAIPLSYGIVSMLSVLHFGRTRQYRFFRFSQLTLILLLPFLLMVALGGFINGSSVILWALICPLGALLFDEPRHAPRWFLAFLGLVILSGILQPFMFVCEPRGAVNVKGKGDMDVWWVVTEKEKIEHKNPLATHL